MSLANLCMTCSQRGRVSSILRRASVSCCTRISGGTRNTYCHRCFTSGHNHICGQNKWQITRLGRKRFASAYELERPSAVLRLSTSVMTDTASDQTAGQGALTVKHDPANREFYIMLGEAKAYLQYEELGGGEVDLYHTLVPPEFRGRGVAKILAQAALDHFTAQSTPMVLTCTYLQKFVKDNPQPQHLQFVVDS